ncbi:N-6 DNA methylase, partial [bacterium]|nr:N-6 DNA methylase [bacterium]
SAGHGEMEVRRRLVETGDVDVMISIRSNFFYTRTVPCELWHFDRAKPQERKDQVLMLDARNVYRKVTRKIYDFSPEQQANLTAIVWLYRGQQARFLGLVHSYIARLASEAAAVDAALTAFEATLTASNTPLAAFMGSVKDIKALPQDKHQGLAEAMRESSSAASAYASDRATLLTGLAAFCKSVTPPPQTNKEQHTARKVFDPLAVSARGLVKQIDLLNKLAARAAQLAQELTQDRAAQDEAAEFFDRRAVGKLTKQLDEERKSAVEQLKDCGYLHRHIAWLQERFPDAVIQDVPGLCKVVTRAEIEAADWSLTPGRFVGVAPAEVDDDFDFEKTLRDIHLELADLTRESVDLAVKIQTNFEALGI